MVFTVHDYQKGILKQIKNELELIEKAKQGETDAFQQLFEAYKVPVYNFVLRMIGRVHDAEDILQEVFVKMHQKLPTLRESKYFTAWLFRVAKNETINYLNKHRRKAFDSIENYEQSFVDNVMMAETGEQNNPGDETEQVELEQTLQKALNELPETIRASFILGVIEGYSYKEVATMLDCSINNVKTRVFRARTLLNKKLRPYLQA